MDEEILDWLLVRDYVAKPSPFDYFFDTGDSSMPEVVPEIQLTIPDFEFFLLGFSFSITSLWLGFKFMWNKYGRTGKKKKRNSRRTRPDRESEETSEELPHTNYVDKNQLVRKSVMFGSSREQLSCTDDVSLPRKIKANNALDERSKGLHGIRLPAVNNSTGPEMRTREQKPMTSSLMDSGCRQGENQRDQRADFGAARQSSFQGSRQVTRTHPGGTERSSPRHQIRKAQRESSVSVEKERVSPLERRNIFVENRQGKTLSAGKREMRSPYSRNQVRSSPFQTQDATHCLVIGNRRVQSPLQERRNQFGETGAMKSPLMRRLEIQNSLRRLEEKQSLISRKKEKQSPLCENRERYSQSFVKRAGQSLTAPEKGLRRARATPVLHGYKDARDGQNKPTKPNQTRDDTDLALMVGVGNPDVAIRRWRQGALDHGDQRRETLHSNLSAGPSVSPRSPVQRHGDGGQGEERKRGYYPGRGKSIRDRKREFRGTEKPSPSRQRQIFAGAKGSTDLREHRRVEKLSSAQPSEYDRTEKVSLGRKKHFNGEKSSAAWLREHFGGQKFSSEWQLEPRQEKAGSEVQIDEFNEVTCLEADEVQDRMSFSEHLSSSVECGVVAKVPHVRQVQSRKKRVDQKAKPVNKREEIVVPVLPTQSQKQGSRRSSELRNKSSSTFTVAEAAMDLLKGDLTAIKAKRKERRDIVLKGRESKASPTLKSSTSRREKKSLSRGKVLATPDRHRSGEKMATSILPLCHSLGVELLQRKSQRPDLMAVGDQGPSGSTQIKYKQGKGTHSKRGMKTAQELRFQEIFNVDSSLIRCVDKILSPGNRRKPVSRSKSEKRSPKHGVVPERATWNLLGTRPSKSSGRKRRERKSARKEHKKVAGGSRRGKDSTVPKKDKRRVNSKVHDEAESNTIVYDRPNKKELLLPKSHLSALDPQSSSCLSGIYQMPVTNIAQNTGQDLKRVCNETKPEGGTKVKANQAATPPLADSKKVDFVPDANAPMKDFLQGDQAGPHSDHPEDNVVPDSNAKADVGTSTRELDTVYAGRLLARTVAQHFPGIQDILRYTSENGVFTAEKTQQTSFASKGNDTLSLRQSQKGSTCLVDSSSRKNSMSLRTGRQYKGSNSKSTKTSTSIKESKSVKDSKIPKEKSKSSLSKIQSQQKTSTLIESSFTLRPMATATQVKGNIFQDQWTSRASEFNKDFQSLYAAPEKKETEKKRFPCLFSPPMALKSSDLKMLYPKQVASKVAHKRTISGKFASHYIKQRPTVKPMEDNSAMSSPERHDFNTRGDGGQHMGTLRAKQNADRLVLHTDPEDSTKDSVDMDSPSRKVSTGDKSSQLTPSRNWQTVDRLSQNLLGRNKKLSLIPLRKNSRVTLRMGGSPKQVRNGLNGKFTNDKSIYVRLETHIPKLLKQRPRMHKYTYFTAPFRINPENKVENDKVGYVKLVSESQSRNMKNSEEITAKLQRAGKKQIPDRTHQEKRMPKTAQRGKRVIKDESPQRPCNAELSSQETLRKDNSQSTMFLLSNCSLPGFVTDTAPGHSLANVDSTDVPKTSTPESIAQTREKKDGIKRQGSCGASKFIRSNICMVESLTSVTKSGDFDQTERESNPAKYNPDIATRKDNQVRESRPAAVCLDSKYKEHKKGSTVNPHGKDRGFTNKTSVEAESKDEGSLGKSIMGTGKRKCAPKSKIPRYITAKSTNQQLGRGSSFLVAKKEQSQEQVMPCESEFKRQSPAARLSDENALTQQKKRNLPVTDSLEMRTKPKATGNNSADIGIPEATQSTFNDAALKENKQCKPVTSPRAPVKRDERRHGDSLEDYQVLSDEKPSMPGKLSNLIPYLMKQSNPVIIFATHGDQSHGRPSLFSLDDEGSGRNEMSPKKPNRTVGTETNKPKHDIHNLYYAQAKASSNVAQEGKPQTTEPGCMKKHFSTFLHESPRASKPWSKHKQNEDSDSPLPRSCPSTIMSSANSCSPSNLALVTSGQQRTKKRRSMDIDRFGILSTVEESTAGEATGVKIKSLTEEIVSTRANTMDAVDVQRLNTQASRKTRTDKQNNKKQPIQRLDTNQWKSSQPSALNSQLEKRRGANFLNTTTESRQTERALISPGERKFETFKSMENEQAKTALRDERIAKYQTLSKKQHEENIFKWRSQSLKRVRTNKGHSGPSFAPQVSTPAAESPQMMPTESKPELVFAKSATASLNPDYKKNQDQMTKPKVRSDASPKYRRKSSNPPGYLRSTHSYDQKKIKAEVSPGTGTSPTWAPQTTKKSDVQRGVRDKLAHASEEETNSKMLSQYHVNIPQQQRKMLITAKLNSTTGRVCPEWDRAGIKMKTYRDQIWKRTSPPWGAEWKKRAQSRLSINAVKSKTSQRNFTGLRGARNDWKPKTAYLAQSRSHAPSGFGMKRSSYTSLYRTSGQHGQKRESHWKGTSELKRHIQNLVAKELESMSETDPNVYKDIEDCSFSEDAIKKVFSVGKKARATKLLDIIKTVTTDRSKSKSSETFDAAQLDISTELNNTAQASPSGIGLHRSTNPGEMVESRGSMKKRYRQRRLNKMSLLKLRNLGKQNHDPSGKKTLRLTRSQLARAEGEFKPVELLEHGQPNRQEQAGQLRLVVGTMGDRAERHPRIGQRDQTWTERSSTAGDLLGLSPPRSSVERETTDASPFRSLGLEDFEDNHLPDSLPKKIDGNSGDSGASSPHPDYIVKSKTDGQRWTAARKVGSHRERSLSPRESDAKASAKRSRSQLQNVDKLREKYLDEIKLRFHRDKASRDNSRKGERAGKLRASSQNYGEYLPSAMCTNAESKETENARTFQSDGTQVTMSKAVSRLETDKHRLHATAQKIKEKMKLDDDFKAVSGSTGNDLAVSWGAVMAKTVRYPVMKFNTDETSPKSQEILRESSNKDREQTLGSDLQSPEAERTRSEDRKQLEKKRKESRPKIHDIYTKSSDFPQTNDPQPSPAGEAISKDAEKYPVGFTTKTPRGSNSYTIARNVSKSRSELVLSSPDQFNVSSNIDKHSIKYPSFTAESSVSPTSFVFDTSNAVRCDVTTSSQTTKRNRQYHSLEQHLQQTAGMPGSRKLSAGSRAKTEHIERGFKSKVLAGEREVMSQYTPSRAQKTGKGNRVNFKGDLGNSFTDVVAAGGHTSFKLSPKAAFRESGPSSADVEISWISDSFAMGHAGKAKGQQNSTRLDGEDQQTTSQQKSKDTSTPWGVSLATNTYRLSLELPTQMRSATEEALHTHTMSGGLSGKRGPARTPGTVDVSGVELLDVPKTRQAGAGSGPLRRVGDFVQETGGAQGSSRRDVVDRGSPVRGANLSPPEMCSVSATAIKSPYTIAKKMNKVWSNSSVNITERSPDLSRVKREAMLRKVASSKGFNENFHKDYPSYNNPDTGASVLEPSVVANPVITRSKRPWANETKRKQKEEVPVARNGTFPNQSLSARRDQKTPKYVTSAFVQEKKKKGELTERDMRKPARQFSNRATFSRQPVWSKPERHVSSEHGALQETNEDLPESTRTDTQNMPSLSTTEAPCSVACKATKNNNKLLSTSQKSSLRESFQRDETAMAEEYQAHVAARDHRVVRFGSDVFRDDTSADVCTNNLSLEDHLAAAAQAPQTNTSAAATSGNMVPGCSSSLRASTSYQAEGDRTCGCSKSTASTCSFDWYKPSSNAVCLTQAQAVGEATRREENVQFSRRGILRSGVAGIQNMANDQGVDSEDLDESSETCFDIFEPSSARSQHLKTRYRCVAQGVCGYATRQKAFTPTSHCLAGQDKLSPNYSCTDCHSRLPNRDRRRYGQSLEERQRQRHRSRSAVNRRGSEHNGFEKHSRRRPRAIADYDRSYGPQQYQYNLENQYLHSRWLMSNQNTAQRVACARNMAETQQPSLASGYQDIEGGINHALRYKLEPCMQRYSTADLEFNGGVSSADSSQIEGRFLPDMVSERSSSPESWGARAQSVNFALGQRQQFYRPRSEVSYPPSLVCQGQSWESPVDGDWDSETTDSSAVFYNPFPGACNQRPSQRGSNRDKSTGEDHLIHMNGERIRHDGSTMR